MFNFKCPKLLKGRLVILEITFFCLIVLGALLLRSQEIITNNFLFIDRCGSITTTSMGLWKKMAALPGVRIIDPFQPGLTPQEQPGDEAQRTGRRHHDRQLQRDHPGRQAGQPGRRLENGWPP